MLILLAITALCTQEKPATLDQLIGRLSSESVEVRDTADTEIQSRWKSREN